MIDYITPSIGWVTYWGTYWISESLIPYDTKSKEIIPSERVDKVVARNMILSLPYSILLWNVSPKLGEYLVDSYVTRFLVSAIIMDAWFYMMHRLMHTKYMYSWHKKHHEFYIPYPLMAVYSSPVEALFCDVTAIGLGPALLNMKGLELEIWMILAALHSLMLHSSTIDGRDHNIHHGKNLCNFGLLSIFDRLFGTYK